MNEDKATANDERDQKKGNWSFVRHKGKNMRMSDYEVWIPKWDFRSEGCWRSAEDIYGRKQVNYVQEEGNWPCLFCHNLNFKWRLSCNLCGAPKDYRKRKSKQGNVSGKYEVSLDNAGQDIKFWNCFCG